MNIPILYEDDDMIVINKPAGITVNRAETTKHEETVQDWAEEHIGIVYEDSGLMFGDVGYSPIVEFGRRGGIVHRLDKETSGILLLAKNPEAFEEVQKQFKERSVEKVYHALAHGKISPEEGEISVPVGRLPWNRKQFGIVPGGRESKTYYKVLAHYADNKDAKKIFSFVELYPKSGRTHQIRVHLKYLGHPIFADYLYAGRKTARSDRKILPRVFLHAAKISLLHPRTKEPVSFEAPLPNELASVLETFVSV